MELRHDDFDEMLGGPEKVRAAAAGPRNGSEFKQESIPTEKDTAASPVAQEADDFDDLLGAAPVFCPDAPIWTAWREESRGGRVTKVPYRTTVDNSASDDPSTWITRAEARNVAARLKTDGRKGTGVFLGGDTDLLLGGVDLDSCYDPVTRVLEPWAQAVVDRFASYAEVSPSGQGVKVFFHYRADDLEPLRTVMKTKWSKVWSRGTHLEIALHLGGRYFAVTDLRFAGSPCAVTVVDRATLLWLIEDAGPAFKGAKGKADGDDKGRDESRSGRAFKVAGDCRRAGMDLTGYRAELGKDPDLAEWAKDARQVKRAWERTRPTDTTEDDFEDLGVDLMGFAMTEDGVARAFTEVHADRLRFCHSSGRWHVWTGTHWRKEETRLAFNWARETARQRAAADPLSKDAKNLAKAAFASAVERFAQADRAFAATADAWDSDHWLLGTPGGTVDLRTGALRDSRQEEMITKTTAAAPIPLDSFDALRDCPRWLAFLDFATGGDAEAIRFLQQWFGYSLTGDTREEALLFVHGIGGSGKSTAINTMAALLGDYATAVDTETITAQKHGRHSTEIARLHGARMAYASETEAGRAWAENRIKQLTGGDTMTARFMRQDDFEFKPQLKLVVVGNNKPAFANVDGAIKRRFNVMPFDQKPDQPDHGLKDALREEFSGILSWATQGCLDWQRNGLIRPAIMRETTAEYLDEMDTFTNWIGDRCETGARYAATTEDLFDSWSWYARQNGEEPGNKRGDFPQRMRERGFVPVNRAAGIRGRGWKGLRIAPQPDHSDNFDDLGHSQVTEGEKCVTH
ncbi:putative DNA primase/helicase [Gemmobacter aquatilis]|uniref:Putative DNA primase/helicase n=1 Tax=Gemmobacter aquatilis TaxID=933059 RepID=A0A1H8HPF1_9RHOB|nr:phage/plasmid primase, P4 family [Gemmobacter aquatilis]SEN57867.1 putative DNA primase/helicase [Gemmobacter aquatilis]